MSGFIPTNSKRYSSLIESVNLNNIIEINNNLLAISPLVDRNDNILYRVGELSLSKYSFSITIQDGPNKVNNDNVYIYSILGYMKSLFNNNNLDYVNKSLLDIVSSNLIFHRKQLIKLLFNLDIDNNIKIKKKKLISDQIQFYFKLITESDQLIDIYDKTKILEENKSFELDYSIKLFNELSIEEKKKLKIRLNMLRADIKNIYITNIYFDVKTRLDNMKTEQINLKKKKKSLKR